ncbi:cutinase family protein [Rhodococcus hoagii]|nr:cutinase family protein [Prescottella equi]NKS72240.1 cutinase family protein [Prescottella equi]
MRRQVGRVTAAIAAAGTAATLSVVTAPTASAGGNGIICNSTTGFCLNLNAPPTAVPAGVPMVPADQIPNVAKLLAEQILAGQKAAATPLPTAPPAATCPAVAVYAIADTGETSSNANANDVPGLFAGPTAAVSGTITGKSVQVKQVPYAAQRGGPVVAGTSGPVTYEQSNREAMVSAFQAITAQAGQCAETKFVLMGDGQGAAVAGDLATTIGNGQGPIPADRLLGAALVADPHQAPGGSNGGTMLGGNLDGRGIFGSRALPFGDSASQTVAICNPTDTVCNAPINGGLIQLGAASSSFDSAQVVEWIGKTIAALTNNPGMWAASEDGAKTVKAMQELLFVAQTNPVGLPAKFTELSTGFGNTGKWAASVNTPEFNELAASLQPQAVVEQGQALAEAFNTGAHAGYETFSVDGGVNTPTWLTGWLKAKVADA